MFLYQKENFGNASSFLMDGKLNIDLPNEKDKTAKTNTVN